MEIIWNFLAVLGAAIWLAILLMPWRPWSTNEYIDTASPCSLEDLSQITVLIPARNEAETISAVLTALKEQGRGLNIILVDDRSTDGTAEAARRVASEQLHIISGKPLPPGWSGKIWALEQGRQLIKTPLTLLMDADIVLRPGIIVTLRNMMKQNDLQFISLMALLRINHFWERMLMPAFVYFFKLIYPFQLSNRSSSRVAAAAGGCIMLETRLLDEIGGFQAIRGELIDDCALARKVKSMGFKTWIGLTHSVKSLRSYNGLGTIWNMVARTAFTQLHYSALLLILCSVLLLVTFCLPVMCLALGTALSRCLSAIALGAMILSYLPTLRFYQLPVWWALTMPLTGILYVGMTWSSAIRYMHGRRSQWKGRIYFSARG